jgi:hypothetical protein
MKSIICRAQLVQSFSRFGNATLWPRTATVHPSVARISTRNKKGFTGTFQLHVYIYFQLRTAAFKAYCAIWVRRSNFRHQASPCVSPRESTQRRKVELWARNVWEFCLNADLHFTFRDLLHAVKLRHGTDGFTFPPKEGVLKSF